MRKKSDMKCPSCGKAHKGYACGTHKVKGYYNGSLYAEASPQQEQEMMAMAPGVRLQASPVDTGPSLEQQAAATVGEQVVPQLASEAVDAGKAFATELAAPGTANAAAELASFAAPAEFAAKKATEEVAKKVGEEAVKSAASAGTSAATAGVSDLAIGLLDDGQIDESEATQAAFTAGGAALGSIIPGVGTAIGAGLGSLVGSVVGGGSKAPAPKAGPLTPQKKTPQPEIDVKSDYEKEILGAMMGMPKVPGYSYGSSEIKKEEKKEEKIEKPTIVQAQSAPQQQGISLSGMAEEGLLGVLPKQFKDGTHYAMQAAEKAKMSPEEIQKKFLEERVVAPAKAFLEERPIMQAPLLLASAARDYERGELPLGKFGGGRLEGGKDRIAYRHKKYGDFEINPESERVSYKKTFRF